MHADIQETIHAIIGDSGLRPRRALEVGGLVGPKSLLRTAALRDAERYCLNLVPLESRDGITAVEGNANDMNVFADERFDLVVSNATLEHDKHFWLSLAEMRRVLAPGGLLIIGAPGYIENAERDQGKSTHTYRVHYRFDYYRFSPQAFREVFFAGMEDVGVQALLVPPRIVGLGFKPGANGHAVDRKAAVRALDAGPLTLDVPVPRIHRVLRRARRALS